MTPWVLGAIALANVITFLLFGLDKWKAGRQAWRIPEFHLLLGAALTGFLGGWLAMSVFRHKTRKTSFRLKMVVATLVNSVWVTLWWKLR